MYDSPGRGSRNDLPLVLIVQEPEIPGWEASLFAEPRGAFA